MADQDLYLQVEQEIASGIQDEAMLSKAKIMAEENGLSANVNCINLLLLNKIYSSLHYCCHYSKKQSM